MSFLHPFPGNVHFLIVQKSIKKGRETPAFQLDGDQCLGKFLIVEEGRQ